MRASSRKWILIQSIAITVLAIASTLLLHYIQGPNYPSRVDYYGEPLPRGAIARMGTIRMRGPNLPFGPTTALSPNGKILATGGSEHIRLWEFPSGKLLREIRDGDRTKSHCALVFLPDGNHLVSLGRYWLCVWDMLTGNRLREIRATGHPVVCSPDGKLLAAPSEAGSISIWEANTLKRIFLLRDKNHTEDHRPTFTTDSAGLVSYSGNIVYHWDLATGSVAGKLTLPRTPDGLSPDGRFAVVASSRDPTDQVCEELEMCLWDTATGKEWLRFKGKLAEHYHGHNAWYSGSAAAFSAGGKTLALTAVDDVVGHKATIAIWDAKTGELRTRLRLPIPDLRSLHFSPDGRMLLTIGTDQAVRVWDVEQARDRRLISVWDYKTGKFLGRSRMLATAMKWLNLDPYAPLVRRMCDQRLTLRWEVEAEKPILEWPTHSEGVASLVFTPDGRSLISGGPEGTVRLWDVASGRPIRDLDGYLLRFSGEPNSVAVARNSASVTPQALVIAFADAEGIIRVQDQNAKPLRSIPLGKHRAVRAIAVTPGGKSVATWSSASDPDGAVDRGLTGMGCINLWDLATGKLIHSRQTNLPHSIYMPRFSLDAQWIAEEMHESRNAAAALIRDTFTGRVARVLAYATKPTREETFTPDGRGYLTLGYPGAHLWELATGKVRFEVGSDIVKLAAVSPDGETLATVSSSTGRTAIELWDTYTGKRLPAQFPEKGWIKCIVFSPDSKLLASGSDNVLIWEVPDLDSRRKPGGKTDTSQLEKWWTDLAGEDAHRAYPAIGCFSRSPADAVRFFSERLQPIASSLNHSAPSAGQRQSSEQDSAESEPLTAEELRQVRAAEVLERIGNADAQELLRKLTTGMPEARLTREAQASLRRLTHRE
jgi:WD40 repeat protein